MDTLIADLIHLTHNHLNIVEILILNPTYEADRKYLNKLSLAFRLQQALNEDNHYWIMYLLRYVDTKITNIKAAKKGYINYVKLDAQHKDLERINKKYTKIRLLREEAKILGLKSLDFNLNLGDVGSRNEDNIYWSYMDGLALGKHTDLFIKLWNPEKHLSILFSLDEDIIMNMLNENIYFFERS